MPSIGSRLSNRSSHWRSRDIEDEVVDTCRELGIGLVPYSPLGRGFPHGAIRTPDHLVAGDCRQQPRAFTANLDLMETVRRLAEDKDVTPTQLALAWLPIQGDDVVPIPGTKRRRYLEENLGALDVQPDSADLELLDGVVPAGDGYPDLSFVPGGSPQSSR